MNEPRTEAIVIGASAGGVNALSSILPLLPAEFALPLLIVVHVPPDNDGLLTEVLRPKCDIRMKEAEDKEPIVGGTIYLSPPDYHLLVESDRSLSLSSDEHVNFSRPSIDVLFESAADVYGPGLVGVILTGGNHDGAVGLRAIREAGGTCLVQSPEEAEMPIMPEAALKTCSNARVMSLKEIGQYLVQRDDYE